MLNTLNGLFIAAVLAGTPLLLGALGEILTEKSGNLNLGVEGMMFMGAITGLAGSYYYEQAVIGSAGTERSGFFCHSSSYFFCGGFSWGTDLQFFDDYAPGKSKCNRSDINNFRNRFRKFFRRVYRTEGRRLCGGI